MSGFPQMTDKAAEAFAEYVDLGPKRSQVLLAEKLHREGRYTSVVSALGSISKWSAKYQWPARIADAVTTAVTRKLEMAAEIDADTFLQTSERLNQAVRSVADTRDIVSIRETVRKSEPRNKATIDVTHSGTIKHAHHDMSAFTDEEIDTLAELAERKLAEAKS